ncbi:MAG TPA: isoprenylcysteine carboxylmethyltransferase family protein, partial [Candidatus Dormibacteraeota bacterium]|nr:isoprenylcysteine carboxylmethyltransferase family protein [Candidatus Dormibacteraeota bacterium]
VALFGLQHSLMARPAFKRWWTRFVPEPAERSTYLMFSNAALLALCLLWQPVGGVLWQAPAGPGAALLYGVYGFGWALLLFATFLINHFDLFGLRQVWLQLLGRPYRPVPFKMRSLYRYVRHPLYLGWFTIFWAAPTMTLTHLLFALGTSAYILIAIQFEERDLITAHPEYEAYRRRVPMLLPFTRRRSGEPAQTVIGSAR